MNKMRRAVGILGVLTLACVAQAVDEGALVIQAQPPDSAQKQAAAKPQEAALPASELPNTLKAISEGKESAERVAALGQLKQFHFKPIPKEVSTAVVRRIMDDSEEQVRSAAVQTIQDLNDEQAKDALVSVAVHPKLKAEQRKNAAHAIRTLDDARLVSAIVTMVTYDVRTGTAIDFQPPRIRAIINPVIPIFLPIDLPDIELRSVSTSIATFGVIALREIARRDMGTDSEAWKKWFEDWKQVREVRMAGKK